MQSGKIRIKDLPKFVRPREKLAVHGRSNLADAELVAMLLGSGSKGQNVIALSEKLLKAYPLQKLGEITAKELIRFPGVGGSKAARILAALELGERIYSPSLVQKIIVRTAEDALEQVKDIAVKKQEHLVVLYLNARHEMLEKAIIGIGSLNSMVITPKEVYSPALQMPCASIIVAHNHPSGDPEPSDDDIKFTRRIHEAGEILAIPLVDHLVVAKNGYFSFRENKLH